jgi:hypothetical protein
MELSIVIVNWKVRDLLDKCLRSVFEQTKGVEFEVFVVDNDSRDGSVEMVMKKYPQTELVASNRNLGFAKANNEAIRRSSGEFVVLLNPDTEIVDNALAKMVEFMRRNPQAAICGPRLLNTDGTHQPSVRCFPGLSSQLLISLKLHHLLPGLGILKQYFVEDFDYGRAAQCDQVMGAAFMVRRSVLQEIGLLDERYFIWFEEVDLCKSATEAGFQTWYTPSATVIHHGGESFGQVFGPDKQRMFNQSCRRYFWKHHGFSSYFTLVIFHPLSMLLAWLVATGKDRVENDGPAAVISETVRIALPMIILVEILSYFGLIYPAFSAAAFVIIVGLALMLAFIRFDLAALMLLAELFIGSQGGYLVSIGSDSGIYVSLRLGLFLAVFGVWAARTVVVLVTWVLRRRRPEAGLEWFASMRRGGLFWPYLALLVVLLFGVVRGLMIGNDFGNIFFDANGYAYFALFPAVIVALEKKEMFWRVVGVLAAAVASSVAKALFVLYVFSHRMMTAAPSIYVWIRDTRVGEITRMVGDFYRIFFQSHLFALTAMSLVLLLAAYARSWKSAGAKIALAAACWMSAGLLLSFSRSFWFGGAGAVLAMGAILVWGRAKAVVWKRLAASAALATVAGVLIVMVVYSVPFPRKGAAVSLASLLGERAFSLSGEAAANSRWALLPILWQTGLRHPLLGSGFGTTATYTTSDPRLLATNPTGEYTTFAFEWGYHDLWIKFGLFGLAIYGWLLWAIVAPLMRFIRGCRSCFREPAGAGDDLVGQKQKAVIAAGLVTAVAALIFTNVFSPYLNHPLGIGLLMLIGTAGARGLLDYPAADPSKTLPAKSG